MDPDYVDPSSRRSKKTTSRPGYRHRWNVVAARQNLKKVAGGYEYDSVVTPGQRNKLDSRKRELVPNHHYPAGKRQKPALDHGIQYANLLEQHHAMVLSERQKPKFIRRSSFDMDRAFRAAVADPKHLSIKSHAEHAKTGRSLKAGQFSSSRQAKARVLLNVHYKRTMSQHTSESTSWHSNRPSYSIQLPDSRKPVAPLRRSRRIRAKSRKSYT